MQSVFPNRTLHFGVLGQSLAIVIALIVQSLIGRGELVQITDRGSASQTSEWQGGLFPAANAIDSDPATFSHTDNNTANNAWHLDFAEDHKIARVELVMRADCCAGRLGGATLRLYDREGDSVFAVPVADPGLGGTEVFDLPAGTVGRSLRVGFEDGATNPGSATTIVHFGEIRVYSEIDLLPTIGLFNAAPTNIAAGAPAVLSWEVEGADRVELIGSGLVPADGSIEVTPSATQVFTLVASNSHGSRTAGVTVLVDGELLPPRINEFMASNDGTITRSDGSTPDWIEIWNPNPVAADLGGYRLTDDPEQPARFVFPPTLVPAGGYLIVDAAATAVDGVAATGFALSRSGGSSLTMSAPDGTTVQTITYPKQRADVSFGTAAGGAAEKFFLLPTPGAANEDSGVDGFVADTQFSVDRGFYESPQAVAIATETPGATIYTTTDGSAPGPDNPAAAIYAGELRVSTTTVLRAAAFLDGFQPTDIDTHTYIFPADVGSQSSSPVGFPSAWVPNLNGVVQPVPAFSHFGMHPGVLGSLPLTDSDGQSFDLADALRAIPTMSLVVDAGEMFDPVEGIHVNARSRGRAWERLASIEFIDPDSGGAAQADCGVRAHGGWNRYPEMLKKSFRLYFRSEYGDSKFRCRLFPGLDRDEFDRLILRSGNGKAWPSPWRALSGGGNSLERTTYLRDQFVRDLQAATGNESIPGRFVHLYINGHYWGLYNPVERPDEHFAAAHFGGDDEDYDVIKWQRGVGHRVAAGDDTGWNSLIALVRDDPSIAATYAAIGELLDLPGFVDYMLINFFVGNIDWVDNNVYAMRNRVAGEPFRFFCWDSEECLLATGVDQTDRFVSDTCTEIHQALRANADYRMLFADRVQRHLFNDGALTQALTDPIFAARAAEIDRAIVGDSARWGDLLRPANPYDRADWITEVNNLRNNYLGQRVGTTINQVRADALFPAVEAPIFLPQRGGQVARGSRVTLGSSGGGTIYYTLDGSDPRLPGGAVSPAAAIFSGGTEEGVLLPLGSEWRFLDDGSDLGDSDIVVGNIAYSGGNWKHPDFDDGSWGTGAAPLGYGVIAGATIATTIGFGGNEFARFTTSYFRRTFEVADSSRLVALRLRLLRDDGAIVYLNGHEVARSEFAAGTTTVSADTFAVGVSGAAEGTLLDFDVSPEFLVDGTNTVSVEVHQASANSSDLGFDLEILGDVAVEGSVIAIENDTRVRTRSLVGGEWSAIDEALFVVGDRATDLYVSELMYHPAAGAAEFLEIANRGAATHTLEDLIITGGIQFQFSRAAIAELGPGERLVLVRDIGEFSAAYPGVAVAGDYDGALGNGGDRFSLERSDGAVLWTLSYGDAAPWPGGTDGGGHSLVFVGGDQNAATSWRPSRSGGGSPGAGDSIPFPPGGDLIEYAIAGQAVAISETSSAEFRVETYLGADEVLIEPEWSGDLQVWSREGISLASFVPSAGGKGMVVWTLEMPVAGPTRLFIRSKLRLRP